MPTTHLRVTPRPKKDTPPQAPAALRAGRVAVIGAGPAGLLCASMLAQRGVPVVVVDRIADPGSTISTRSYALVLNGRAERVLETCPGLLARVAQASTESRSLRLDAVDPAARYPVLDIRVPPAEPSFRFVLRDQIVTELATYARDQQDPPVEWRLGVELASACFNDDGSTTLRLATASSRDAEPQEEEEELTVAFVVGCDGRGSGTLAALRAAEAASPPAPLASRKGFAERAWANGSSGKTIKAVVLEKEVRAIVAGMLPAERDWPDDAGFMLQGETRGRPSSALFSVSCLPTAAKSGLPGGRQLGAVMVEADSPIVRAATAAEAFRLFEENFPHLPVRDFITEESMQQFVANAGGYPIGKVRRPASIAAAVGAGADYSQGTGGVVLLGDAAHSFPPDVGQGLNSGLEDVGALMSVIDAAATKATAGDVAREYDRVREPDVEGVVFLNRFGARWQFGQRLTLDGSVWLAGFLGRLMLHRVAPSLFNPPVAVMMGRDVSFGEIKHQAKKTTRRIWLGVVAIAFVAVRRLLPRSESSSE